MTVAMMAGPELVMFMMPITLTLIVCLFFTWYFLHKARHNEKILLIEKGLEPLPKNTQKSGSSLLKIGIVIIGLSIGIAIDTIMSRTGWFFGDGVSIAIFGICGGVSLIIANKAGKTDEQ